MAMLNFTDYKVIFVGEPSVGKTSIIQQYSAHVFDSKSEATVGASYVSKLIETSVGSVQVNIWDTAGQERYRSLIPMYSRNAVAAVLVVDLTNRASYDNLDLWARIISSNCAPSCRTYVCANKADLEAIVPVDELEAKCQAKGFPFFKTSATDLKSVTAVFDLIGQDLITKGGKPITPARPIAKPEKEKCC
jgi:small GTP-binding protein